MHLLGCDRRENVANDNVWRAERPRAKTLLMRAKPLTTPPTCIYTYKKNVEGTDKDEAIQTIG
jgi:hypothetical protein